MSVSRARVELKDLPSNSSYQDRDIAFRKLMTAFKKAVSEAGILNAYRQHEVYEKPGERRRRKNRQAESTRLKAKLKENFPRKGGDKKKGEK